MVPVGSGNRTWIAELVGGRSPSVLAGPGQIAHYELKIFLVAITQGFTYDYVFDWNMLKFGGTRPDAPESAHPDGKERKPHRQHQRALASGLPGVSGAMAGGAIAGPSSTPTPMEMTSKGSMQQMAPPDVPFGTGQPPVVNRS